MNVTVLGWKTLDFTSDGQQIKGTNIYTSFPEKGVEGEMCDKMFIRPDIPLPTLKPGMVLDISYNRKGKPERIEAVPSTKQLNLSNNR